MKKYRRVMSHETEDWSKEKLILDLKLSVESTLKKV